MVKHPSICQNNIHYKKLMLYLMHTIQFLEGVQYGQRIID